ncbi:MAG TPA: hypothetical protein VFT12_03725, partial [Thermoanaerobaculia bacterium]|nr:hypothetical protein [Thermoanaerobaculia bacterium]
SIQIDDFSVRMTAAGDTPVDLAIARGGTALSAPSIAIADPAAKRVWVTEGAQSVGAAFGRGFLRGLLGIGLFRPRSATFPTGVDRIVSAEGITAAYDSSSRTLYRVEGSRSRPIAQDVSVEAFTIAFGRIEIWRAGALVYPG